MKEKKIFAIVLGGVALLADAITILQFVENSNFVFSSDNVGQEFWTFAWIMSIILITVIYAIGFGLLTYGFGRTPEIPALLLGGVYITGALIIYLRWGYLQLDGELDFTSFLAITLLFIVATTIGLITVRVAGKEFLRFPSYAFGIFNIAYLFMITNKYVFSSEPFHWGFLGEALILITGSVIFMYLFFIDE